MDYFNNTGYSDTDTSCYFLVKQHKPQSKHNQKSIAYTCCSLDCMNPGQVWMCCHLLYINSFGGTVCDLQREAVAQTDTREAKWAASGRAFHTEGLCRTLQLYHHCTWLPASSTCTQQHQHSTRFTHSCMNRLFKWSVSFGRGNH